MLHARVCESLHLISHPRSAKKNIYYSPATHPLGPQATASKVHCDIAGLGDLSGLHPQ